MYYLNGNKLLAKIIIILFVFLTWFFCNQQWSPGYPVEAQVFYRPGSIRVKAPFSGVVRIIFHHEGDLINQNDKLLILENLHYLSVDNLEREKLLRLKKQSNTLKGELLYQKKLLSQIKQLVKNKLLSENEYHTKRQQYYQILSNYHDIEDKIMALTNQHRLVIKAPVSGRLIHMNYKEGEEVPENKVLFRIKPYKSQPWVKLKLPFDYQEVIATGQLVKLSKLNQSFIKKYPYEAIIQEISFFSNHSSQDKYYVAKAKLKHHFDLQELAPLRGFVIGKPQKIWHWLISNWD